MSMIKKLNIESFYSNSEKLSILREELGIKKNEIVKELKKVGIDSIGSSRTYARLENKELKFDYKTFESLAKGLNLLFKKNKKSKKNINATDLYIKDLAEDKNSYTSLNKIIDASDIINLIHKCERKKVFGLSEIERSAAEHIEQLFDALAQVSNEEFKSFSSFDDEDIKNFENEKRIIDISSFINTKLNLINRDFGIKLFAGAIEVPMIYAFPKSFFNSVNGESEYNLVGHNAEYLIYKFEKKDTADFFDVKYTNPISLKGIKNIIDKYKIEKKYEDSKNRESILLDLKSELSSKLIDAGEYQYLPVSMDRTKIEFTEKMDFEDEIPF